MTLPVTAFVTAMCAILLLVTAIDTVRNRFRTMTPFGDKEDPMLIRAVRSHGNLAEHAPIVIILFALLELAHADQKFLTSFAILFVGGRLLHIIGLYMTPGTKPPLPRTLGVILTWLTILVLSCHVLWLLATTNL